MSGAARCMATTKSGSPCQGRPLPGTDRCAFHSGEGREGRKAGGRSRMRKMAVVPEGDPDLPFATAADVKAALADTLARVRKGNLDVKVANCVGFLAGVLLKAIEQGDLAEKVKEIEQLLKGAKGAAA